MTEPLKPCPFCGGEAWLYSIQLTGKFEYSYGTECKVCFVVKSKFDSEELAIEGWNTRTKSPEYEKLLAFVRSLLKHTCCLCNSERCRCCNAKDLLQEIGEDV